MSGEQQSETQEAATINLQRHFMDYYICQVGGCRRWLKYTARSYTVRPGMSVPSRRAFHTILSVAGQQAGRERWGASYVAIKALPSPAGG
jgi:hypothetical protein